MKKLLLIIDMQNGFFRNFRLRPERKDVAQNIKDLIIYFKLRNHPIVYTTIIHKSDGSTLGIETASLWNIEGTSDANIIDEIIPDNKSIIVNKLRFSAFHNTPLLELIKEHNISEIYLTGLTASMCIMSTSLDCYNHDIKSKVVIDAIMDESQESLDFFSNHFLSKEIGAFTKEITKPSLSLS